jgi:hypothetical protein
MSAINPLHGKYGRVRVNGVIITFLGEWNIDTAVTTHDISTFEDEVGDDGFCLEQAGVGRTKCTGTMKGRFTLDQVPENVDIFVGGESTVTLDLLVMKPDIGYVVEAVWTGEKLSTAITDMDNVELAFHINKFVSSKWE